MNRQLTNPPVERATPCPYCGKPTVPYTPAIAAHNGGRYHPTLYGELIHVARKPGSFFFFACGIGS